MNLNAKIVYRQFFDSSLKKMMYGSNSQDINTRQKQISIHLHLSNNTIEIVH